MTMMKMNMNMMRRGLPTTLHGIVVITLVLGLVIGISGEQHVLRRPYGGDDDGAGTSLVGLHRDMKLAHKHRHSDVQHPQQHFLASLNNNNSANDDGEDTVRVTPSLESSRTGIVGKYQSLDQDSTPSSNSRKQKNKKKNKRQQQQQQNYNRSTDDHHVRKHSRQKGGNSSNNHSRDRNTDRVRRAEPRSQHKQGAAAVAAASRVQTRHASSIKIRAASPASVGGGGGNGGGNSGVAILNRNDNVFLDRSRAKLVAAPGDAVVIRCVTPWLGMVNAWKKNDVVLPSGRAGVAMSSVRLRHEQAEKIVDEMAAIEEREAAAREARLQLTNIRKISAVKNREQAADTLSVDNELAGGRSPVGTSPADDQQLNAEPTSGTGAENDSQILADQDNYSVEAGRAGDGQETSNLSEKEEDEQEQQEQEEGDSTRVAEGRRSEGPARNTRPELADRLRPQQRGQLQQPPPSNSVQRAPRSRHSRINPKGPTAHLRAALQQGQKLELWTLRLEAVTPADAGNYTCGGEASTYFHLRVTERRSGALAMSGKTRACRSPDDDDDDDDAGYDDGSDDHDAR